MCLFVQHRNSDALKKMGGVEGLAAALLTTTTQGLDPQAVGIGSLESRRAEFGINKFTELPQKHFFALLFENLQDPTLILLMGAALVCQPSLKPIGYT
jgi:P-type Ca2+ transporter type 2C